MEYIIDGLEEWFRGILTSGIHDNLKKLFDFMNVEVAETTIYVGQSPQAWNSGIYNMIHNLSQSVILPIAGVILAFVMTLELIQLITEKNNMNDVDTWMFFKWVFKTACAVVIVTNTWNIIMGIFDVAQNVVNSASGVLIGSTNMNLDNVLADLDNTLETLSIGELLGMWFQSGFLSLISPILSILVMIIAYSRMIEIYLVTSIAPIPMATMTHHEWGQMGQNYIRSLLALAFQGFLLMVCIAIYAVLIANIPVRADITTAVWTSTGYTILLCFTMFKTGSLAKSIFRAS